MSITLIPLAHLLALDLCLAIVLGLGLVLSLVEILVKHLGRATTCLLASQQRAC